MIELESRINEVISQLTPRSKSAKAMSSVKQALNVRRVRGMPRTSWGRAPEWGAAAAGEGAGAARAQKKNE